MAQYKVEHLHAIPCILISLLLSLRTMYCDETADECSGINVHQPTAFAHKLLQLSGVSFFWDEFPASAKSSPVCSATQLVKFSKLYKDVKLIMDEMCCMITYLCSSLISIEEVHSV